LGATAPSAVGTYKVKAIVDGTNNYDGCEVEKDFAITKAKATWSAPTFTGGVNGKYYMNQFGYSTSGLTATHAGQTVAGTFAFGAPQFAAGENASYIELTFTPADTANYETVAEKYYVTFVTVATNTTTGAVYGSIEAALAAAVSGNTVRVQPHDTELGSIYIMSNVEIKAGVTLILPYGVDGSGVNTFETSGKIDVPTATQNATGTPADETKCHVMVVLAAGKTMTNNGTLQIAGQLSGGAGASKYAGFTAGEHARLILDAGAELVNNGTIYAAGFIRELNKNNGSKVTINSGSTLWQPFTVRDFPGGSVTYAIYNTMGKSEPITAFSRFILMNVSPETHINYGGSVKVWALLYAGSQINQTVADMIGYGATNTTAVIALTDETYSKIISKYDVDTEVCDLDLYGGAKTNSMKLTVKVGFSVTVNTKDALFAVSHHYDVSLNRSEGQDTATFEMGQRFKIMTGAKFTVGEGVILNATDIIVYEKFEDIRSDAGTDPNHPMRYPNKPAAIFTVNGTLNVNNFGGKIYSTVEGAVIKIQTSASYTAYEIDTTSGSSLSAKVDSKNPITENAALVNGDSTTVSPSTATYYTFVGGVWKVPQIIFDSNGGTAIDPITITPTMSAYPELSAPTKDGFEFIGWHYNGVLVKQGDTLPTLSDNRLVAQWAESSSIIVVVYDNGTTTEEVKIANGVYPTVTNPIKEGYTFQYWAYNGERINAGDALKVEEGHTLTAVWKVNTHTIEGITTSEATVSGISKGQSVDFGTTVTFTVKFNKSDNKTVTVTDANGNKITTTNSGDTYSFTMPDSNVTISASSQECIVAGTLITLADGTQKKVEDLTVEDILLVFNHETGEYEAAGIIFIEDDGWKEYNVITLTFSDGTTTKLIYEHAYFDLTLNKYVYITEQNYTDFIGHEFAMQSANGFERVTMTDATLAVEYTGCYSLVTVYHLNYFVDGLFSIPGGITGLFNFFEYGDDLVYDAEKMQADIDEYGLYTYEDFEEYLPYELYAAFPAPYLKVAVGKGMITFEEILGYIDQFLVKNGLM